MKSTIKLAFAVSTALGFLTACNGSGATGNKDSTATSASASTASAQDKMKMTSDATQDTTGNGNTLMKAHEDMMNRMHSMKMSGDFDMDWANMMVEHHQGAVDMAQAELSQGKDEKMKSKAQEIITKQKDEQDKLREIVKNAKPSGMKHGEGELQKSMSDMSSGMITMQMSGNGDKDFATMMAAHHKEGIVMSKKEVEYGMNGQLKQMAQKGIIDQTKEVEELNAWLSSHK